MRVETIKLIGQKILKRLTQTGMYDITDSDKRRLREVTKTRRVAWKAERAHPKRTKQIWSQRNANFCQEMRSPHSFPS